MDANVNANAIEETEVKNLEDLTPNEIKEYIKQSSVQFAYRIDPIGRVHIRQTGNYITGIVIDDDSEFHWDIMALETDLILKVAIELIRYSKGESNHLDQIPSFIPESDPDILQFYQEITELPIGTVTDINELQPNYVDKLDELEFDILIPTHRLTGYVKDPVKEYYEDKLLVIERRLYRN